MNEEQMIDLARRAVACNGWRWVRGMLRQDDYRYIGSGVWARWSDVHSLTTALHAPGQLPDLADAATQGCIIALLDEAYGEWWAEPPASPNKRGRWAVYVWNGYLTRRIATGATRTEALIAALEAAP